MLQRHPTFRMTLAQLQKKMQFLDFTSMTIGLFLYFNAKFFQHLSFTIINGMPLLS